MQFQKRDARTFSNEEPSEFPELLVLELKLRVCNRDEACLGYCDHLLSSNMTPSQKLQTFGTELGVAVVQDSSSEQLLLGSVLQFIRDQGSAMSEHWDNDDVLEYEPFNFDQDDDER